NQALHQMGDIRAEINGGRSGRGTGLKLGLSI
ncbi:unnamed protein product, partial [marine sediment metagenome]